MRKLLFLAVLGIAGLASPCLSQDPAQPQAEIDVVERFEAAVDDLFQQWLKRRPDSLKAAGLGVQGTAASGCLSGKGSYFFEFIECSDIAPPQDFALDVVRSDSLRSPFVGVIKVPVNERCDLRRVVASKMMAQKKFDEIAPQCLGHSFEECIAAGGRLAPKLLGSACTGGPGVAFAYQGEVTLHYRWSKGQWEFEEESVDPPRAQPTKKSD